MQLSKETLLASSLSAPRFNVHTAEFAALPGFGAEAILYRSADGTRLAGSFRESGVHTMTMPFDEFIYVVAGSTTISIDGGETFSLTVGDCCYLQQGWAVTFNHSDDFHDVTVLISDQPIEY